MLANGSPDISVVLPVRNGERYIDEALQSLLGQEGVDLEVIVVDDGSTDSTPQRLREFADPRLRVIPGPQNGVAEAMNTGLAHVRGRYICRCDSDDRYPRGRLAQQMAFLESHPDFGAVCGRFEVLDRHGNAVRLTRGAGERAHELTADLCRGQVEVHLCTYLVRREPLLAVGGFRRYFRTGSDIDFQLRLCERTRVWYEPLMRYGYRLHENSITHRHSDRLLRFNDNMSRLFQRQRTERRARGEPGLDDLDLGHPPDPPENGEAPASECRDAREQLWNMRWGQAWHAHAQGDRARGVLVGLRATLMQPWRSASWRGLAALCLKSTPLWGPRPRNRAAEGKNGGEE